jgi:HD-GYP domain-containing protein (c-di-GMP phosphodiesterase class II)
LSVSIGYATKTSEEQTISEILKTGGRAYVSPEALSGASEHSRTCCSSTIKELLFSKSNENRGACRANGKTRARRLGAELALNEVDIVSLELMATLHDIGKIGISNSILSKPGKLDELEWTEIRRHPEMGYRIARPFRSCRESRAIYSAITSAGTGRGIRRASKARIFLYFADRLGN